MNQITNYFVLALVQDCLVFYRYKIEIEIRSTPIYHRRSSTLKNIDNLWNNTIIKIGFTNI